MKDPHLRQTVIGRLLAFVLLVMSTGAIASAQTPEADGGRLDAALVPGTTVWITDSAGLEHKVRIVGVSGGVVTAAAGEDIQRLRIIDVTRVRVRESDSIINGALIGAGAAVATGLLLCSLTETWDNCRDDVGPMLRIGAIGAGAGIGIDALVRGRKTIFERPAGAATQLRVSFTF